MRHELGIDRPVPPSSKSLFKGLPIRLRPFGLKYSNTFFIVFLFILLTCRRQSDLYLLCFLSAGSNFNCSTISSLLFWSKSVYRLLFLKILSRVKSFIFYPFLSFLILFYHFSKSPNLASIWKNGESHNNMFVLLNVSGPNLAQNCCLEFEYLNICAIPIIRSAIILVVRTYY
jgi:hypothetical protein